MITRLIRCGLSHRERKSENIQNYGKKFTHKRDITAEDEISWKWTADGEYSTKSAYQIQFEGKQKKKEQ